MSQKSWVEQNQAYLSQALLEVRELLAASDPLALSISSKQSDALAADMSPPPALVTITKAFGLSHFERFILLLCVGYELDTEFANSLEGLKRIQSVKPTFGMALSLFSEAHWSAFAPISPLRYWRLLEVENDSRLMDAPLKLDERILHFLTGISYLDDRLQGFVKPVQHFTLLVPSHTKSVDQVIHSWPHSNQTTSLPVMQLCGKRTADLLAICLKVSQTFEWGLYRLDANNIPTNSSEREALARLWTREAILDKAALVIVSEDYRSSLLTDFVQELFGPCFILGEYPCDITPRAFVRVDVSSIKTTERKTLWQESLGDKAALLNGGIDHVASQFDLKVDDIVNLGRNIKQTEFSGDEHSLSARLWQECRLQARKQLDSLAQRIDSVVSWDDLIIPIAQKHILRDIVAHVRQRYKVYQTWGFAKKMANAQGSSALFYGDSGTGKTMAAEVLANELQLDLYRVDLSQVVDKYIGETEKNLKKIFDAAESSGAILLFDEADSLFSKRSEVKSSLDRNANMEVSYLLQRMESYSGLAILTTNLKKEIDTAFLRRIRFSIQFPFPDVSTRKQIWSHIFPEAMPVSDLDPQKLASLNIAGGNIRNIALNAAFIAADQGDVVTMEHLAQAARREFSKIEKSISENELKGWV